MPVNQRFRREETSPAPPHVLDDGIGTLDPKIGLELTCEAGSREILRDGARADRDSYVLGLTAQLAVGDTDLLGCARGQLAALDQRPKLLAHRGDVGKALVV